MNKKLKMAISLLVISGTFLFCLSNSYSADYKSPHKLKAGDVISADVINEMFDTIELSNRSIKPTDLLGSWTCSEATSQTDGVGYTLSSDGIIYVRTEVLTFTDNLDGTYTWLSEKYDPLMPTATGSYSGNYTVINNRFVGNTPNYGFLRNSPVRLVGPTRFVLPSLSAGIVLAVSCDKNNIAPAMPTNQTVSVTDKDVTLTWLDGSSDETSFSIMRRDTIDGQYAEVGVVAANVTSYQETLVDSGTYWYRVEAVNSNGHSYGSNVVKVVIP